MQCGATLGATGREPRNQRRRYTEGGSPQHLVNKVLKLPTLEKPTAKQTCVTEPCIVARSSFA